MKLSISCAFIFLFYFPTFAQSNKVDSSQMRTLRIDPETARGTSVAQVFDEVHFIPLETTKESLFGSINQLEVTDNNYVIYDYDTKSVLIFNNEGKFIARVDGSKLGKEAGEKEAQNFYGFMIKRENDQELIQIYSGKYVIYFDLTGKLIKKVPAKGINMGGDTKFADGTIFRFNYMVKKDKDSSFFEVGLLKGDKEVAKFFPFSMDRHKNDQFFSGGKSVYDSRIENELFYLRYYEYNIYKITPSAVSLAYHLIFPANNSIPSDFENNPVYKGKRQEYFEKYPNAIYALSNIYKIGDLLFLKTHSWQSYNSKKNALIYNLKKNELTSIMDIEPDSTSSFLPVTDAGFHYDFLNHGFHTYDGKYFYTSYSSLAMFAFKEQSAGKNPKYNAVLTNYFKTENKKSNPVLIVLKLKQD